MKNSNVSKMIQANSLLLNFQMKSPCYLVTLSLESSDFQTFLKQYVILVPSGALIILYFDGADCITSNLGVTLRGKNLLPKGANSFL